MIMKIELKYEIHIHTQYLGLNIQNSETPI